MKFRSASILILVLILYCLPVNAADKWVEVNTANFHVIGNSDAKQVENVALRLEQFRHIFGLLFPNIKLSNSIETNVIVFKSKHSYTPFLPKKKDGTPDKFIDGYFLGGEDANYITLNLSKNHNSTYGIIFHEYVHYLLRTNFDSSELPPWLNEGLAEYYSTFEVEKDQKVYLGNIRSDHLNFLSNNDLIPLREFFAIDNFSLHRNGNHSRSVFYAQAWALIHYFAVKNETTSLTNFMTLSRTEDPETAFKKALGFTYEEMEKTLKDYVKQRKFQRLVARFNNKIDFESGITTTDLAEEDAQAYLGDLLYRQQDYWSAEGYLNKSLAVKPDGVRANTVLGLVKMRQKQYETARKYLEKAVSQENSGYFAHYSYAYALSREGLTDGGFVISFKPEAAKKMQTAAKRAIELKPDFVPSYTLLAFINIVMNDELEQAADYLRQALKFEPGNENAIVHLAQIHLRLKKYKEAERYANAIINSSKDEGMRQNASQVLDTIKRFQEFEERNNSDGPVVGKRRLTRIPGKVLSEEERERIEEETTISSMNKELPALADGDRRIMGNIEQISCNGQTVNYRVRGTDGELIRFQSDGFQRLELIALVDMTNDENVSCNFKSKSMLAVFDYTPMSAKTINGMLNAMVFVPKNFRIKSKEEMENDSSIAIFGVDENGEGQAVEIKGGTPDERAAAFKKRQNEIHLAQMRDMLRKPKPGEKRIVGTIEKIECDSRGFGIALVSGIERLMFWSKKPQQISIRSMGPQFDASMLACGAKPKDNRVVVSYKPSDGDVSNKGTVVALEFVPDDLTLEP